MTDRSSADRVADRAAAVLRAAGIRHAFGMPGGEVITFVDALERAGIRFVLARNETAAAMMAAGTAADGARPGLLVTTLGPGLANAVNGIADAAQERTPLIVVSGVVERPIRSRYTHQIVDHAALLRPLVKASFEIEPDAPEATVARAVRLALTPPFGPVHIDLSPVVAAMPATGAPLPVAAGALRPARLDPDPAQPRLADLRARLAAAERPLVIAGFEAARSGAAAPLAALVERLGIPVITTYKGKGVVDERHPLSLGAAGLSPLADKVLLDLVRRADLVLLAGYDAIEMRPGWLQPFADPQAVVEIGEATGDHGMHEAGLRIAGPVGPVLGSLVPPSAGRGTWPEGEPELARRRLRELFAAPDPWGPHAVFDALAAALPPDAVVTVDSGAHRILISQRWQASGPLQMLQSAGWCTMGSAVPLAIGAALDRPGRPVVAVLGDGGLEMTLGELGTLRDAGIPVVVLVLQDESLALIELKQRQSELAPLGVTLGATRFDAVAEAFGGHGATVTDTDALRAALDRALAADRFSVIACRIDRNAYRGRI